MQTISLTSSVLALVVAPAVLAWSGYDVTEGPVRVAIDEIPVVTDPGKSVPVRVRVRNTGDVPLTGKAVVRDLVDAWETVGDPAVSLRLEPGREQEAVFRIRSGRPVYSALYPVHVYVDYRTAAGKTGQVHAVRIFEVRLPAPADQWLRKPPALEPLPLCENACLPLIAVDQRAVCWQWFGKAPFWRPPGWRGSDSKCRAYFNIVDVTRGERRRAISMHPPWRPEAGTIFCDFMLRLPKQRPLSLLFGIAIRDNTAKEPPSDGVLFRVWVGSKPDGSDARPVFERFTATKVWQDARVDLSPWAGKTILLRLESHPGPAKDTTCDQSFWSEPMIVAGRLPDPQALKKQADDRLTHALSAAGAVLEKRLNPDGRLTYELAPEGALRRSVAVVPGRRGLLDAVYAAGVQQAGGKSRTVGFSGLEVDIDGLSASSFPSAWTCRNVDRHPVDGGVVYRHELVFGAEKAVLRVALRRDGPGLRIEVGADAPHRITRVQVGRWSAKAERVFYGHGYCIVDPEPFTAGFGGHNLATSYVAAEYTGGPAVLQAVENPPDRFEVAPAARVYALTTHMNGALTLVPGASAFECATAYRPLDRRRPASGVRRLAGRFCFDIWGGKYAEIAKRMEEMFRYGLTDSFLTVHVWQRWGYDYRLPDVFPPNPALGTVEDMRRIGQVCGEHDVPWGLHDNYIDFYPDATDYSYRHICFTPGGQPIKAWYNEGRDAQSYRWRPDHIMPFVQRNLRVIRRELRPTHYFLDVFTSAGCFDFYDWKGRFHPNIQTRRCWGEVFAWIRNYLGGNAPTTSEAGHDQLIGWLDGADCQWLTLSPTARRFAIRLPCKDWERVPWYDAVHHRQFILHGVGYSGRYQGGRSRALHGINSDDYLSAEVLSGHALMVDAGSWGRAAVRKYWFLQGVARRLALRNIESVRFDGGDIHRQTVRWDDGTVVCVNRGESPWRVDGHVLPQYGFVVRNADRVLAALEEKDGRILEYSVGDGTWYLNARTAGVEPDRTVDILPQVESFEPVGDHAFRYVMAWHANEATRHAMRIFVHFCSSKSRRRDQIAFQDDHDPPVPTNRWHGVIRYTRTVSLPEDAAGDYQFLVGLYGPGGRLELRGKSAGQSRILVGTVHVERRNGKIAGIRFEPPPPPDPLPRPRLNPPGTLVDAGFASTDGAFRVVRRQDGVVRILPLPESTPFRVDLNWAEIAPGTRPAAVHAVTAEGKVVEAVPFDFREGRLRLTGIGAAFACDVRTVRQE